MRHMVVLAVTAVIAFVAGAALGPRIANVSGGPTLPPNFSVQHSASPADIVHIQQFEVVYHKAASTKDIDAVMSLFADNANLYYGGQVYHGKDQIRTFFTTVPGWSRPENQWIAVTPSDKMRISIDGDRGKMYYECVYIDTLTNQVKAHIWAEIAVVRSNGQWLITEKKAGPMPL